MSLLALTADRVEMELRQYSREKEAVFFSFLFPILMLGLFSIIFASSFKSDPGNDGISAAHFFLPGMMAAGVMLTSFQTMAIAVATERDDGTLKRMRATPMPRAVYFLGKIGLVLVTSLLQFALLLLIARLAFDVPMPSSAARWGTLAWVFLLGISAGTTLGIAYSSLASSARSAGAIIIGPALILQFISGVYFAFRDLPTWLQQIASIFPLKWVAQGMRSVFFPDDMARTEMAGGWEHERTALVLLAWTVAGLALCVTTFSWTKRRST